MSQCGSLFRRKGGKKSQKRMPSESEGLAMAAAAAMQWAKLRSSSNPMFFQIIASECKRLKCTQADWSRDEMVHFVHSVVFNSIPQEGLELHLTRTMSFVKRDERARLFMEFVASVIYKYLSTVDAGRDPDAAMELAVECKLLKVLRNEALGGCEEWTLEEFIDPTPWEACGGQPGMREVSRKFITLIAAGGQKGKPLDPVCSECGELKWVHKGDRMNLAYSPCGCDRAEVTTANASSQARQKRKAATPETEEQSKSKRSTRGFGDDLDPTAQGIFDTNERKYVSLIRTPQPFCLCAHLCVFIDSRQLLAPSRRLAIIAKRYLQMEPKTILNKLLGTDVSIDDPIPAGRGGSSTSTSSVGVTGEQGGKLLACYLHELEQTGEGQDIFSEGGAGQWLEKVKPKVLLRPAAKLCIEQALKFLPKLKAGLDAHKGDPPDGDDDEDLGLFDD